MRIYILHTLIIKILWRRSLEVLDALDELNAGTRFLGRNPLEKIISALRLVCFLECLRRGSGYGSVVCARPWRGVVDRGVSGEVAGYEKDGLRGRKVLLDA
jgi:hypothetical protein